MRIRPGVTRAEVLVSLLTVVLVVGLFLVATDRMRGAADRMNCANNFKQLGLGVHNYQDTNNKLPPLADQGEGALTGRGVPSAFGVLITFLEATPMTYRPYKPPEHYYAHSSVTFTYEDKQGGIGTYNGGVVNQDSRLFRDPADTTTDQLRDVPMTLPGGATGYYATGSYAANGLLAWGRGKLPGVDAVMIAERPQVCRPDGGDAVYNLWGLGIYCPHMAAFAVRTPDDPPDLIPTGHVVPTEPLADQPAPQRVRVGGGCDPRLPVGPHRDGLQVGMADGSVRTFGWAVDPAVFWAACRPAE